MSVSILDVNCVQAELHPPLPLPVKVRLLAPGQKKAALPVDFRAVVDRHLQMLTELPAHRAVPAKQAHGAGHVSLQRRVPSHPTSTVRRERLNAAVSIVARCHGHLANPLRFGSAVTPERRAADCQTPRRDDERPPAHFHNAHGSGRVRQ